MVLFNAPLLSGVRKAGRWCGGVGDFLGGGYACRGTILGVEVDCSSFPIEIRAHVAVVTEDRALFQEVGQVGPYPDVGCGVAGAGVDNERAVGENDLVGNEVVDDASRDLCERLKVGRRVEVGSAYDNAVFVVVKVALVEDVVILADLRGEREVGH